VDRPPRPQERDVRRHRQAVRRTPAGISGDERPQEAPAAEARHLGARSGVARLPPNRTADAAVDRPKTKTVSTASVRHTVKKGETVAQIARAYGVSPADIQRANGLSRNAFLRPGQHLKLPAGAAQDQPRAARKNLASSLVGPLSDASERKYVVKRGTP